MKAAGDPRPSPGGSVPQGRLVEPRARRLSPTRPVGQPPWPPARRLSHACMADPATLPRARRLSPAGQAGGAPRLEAESRQDGWSTRAA